MEVNCLSEEWKAQYEEWLRKDRSDAYGENAYWITIEPLRKMVDEHLPKSLFKYMGCDEKGFYKRALKDGIVGLRSAYFFNDPYDTLLKVDLAILDKVFENFDVRSALGPKWALFRGTATVDELYPYKTKEAKEMYLKTFHDEEWTVDKFDYWLEHREEHRQMLIERNRRFMKSSQEWMQSCMYISCFCERVDNMLLWSHYADSHKGFALEYDFAEGANAESGKYLFPVVYSDKKYDASWETYELISDYNDGDMEYVRNYMLGLKSALFKSRDWAYESEWRLVMRDLENRSQFGQLPLKAKAIYYGTRMSDEHRVLLHAIALELGLTEYQMEIDVESDGYEMGKRRV